MPKQPRWNVPTTSVISNAWVPMGRAIENKLKDRGIDAAFFTLLEESTIRLEDAAGGKSVVRGNQKASTQELGKTMRNAADLVAFMRETLRRLFPQETGLHAAVGAKGKTPTKSLPDLLVALDQLIEGLARYPSFAAAAQILPADVDLLKKFRQDLRDANTAQEALKGSSKLSTAAVRSLHQDVIGMLDRLYTAVMLSHANDKQVVERFRAVIPTARTKKKTVTPTE